MVLASLRDYFSRVFLADLPLRTRAAYLCFSLALFVALASQQFIGPVKTAIFFDSIGPGLEPLARTLVLPVLVPVLFFYGLIATRFTRKLLVLFVCAFYGAVYLVVGIVLLIGKGHMGVWLPWLLYFATETKGVIIMPMIWSVVADVTPPELARQTFPAIFFVIQIGGILGSLMAVKVSSLGGEVGLILLQTCLLLIIVVFAFAACHLLVAESHSLEEGAPLAPDTSQPITNGGEADAISGGPRSAPGYRTSGDAVAPELRKQTAPVKKVGRDCWCSGGRTFVYEGMEGLWLLLSRPYVFLTFWVSYANLVPRTVLDYESQVLINTAFPIRADKIAYLGKVNLAINVGVAVVALTGTRFIVEKCGMRLCLLLLPLTMLCCMIGLCASYGLQASVVALIVSSITAYGLNSPCKEILYVRTSREIKYKAKSWSEMSGNQVMRLIGAQINLWVNRELIACTGACFHPRVTMIIAAAWVAVWMGAAATVGAQHRALERDDKYVT